MNFRIPVIILISAMAATAVSCSDDDNVQSIVIDNTALSNIEVTSFAVKGNNKIAENLDSLFFSIDLDQARIFNADSLPVGSKPGKAIVTLSLPTVSKAEFVMRYDGGKDSVVNYLEKPNDSIDFAADRLSLRVVSADAKYMREYEIKMNVHKVKPDSLFWDYGSYRPLPGGLRSLTAQKTVENSGIYYTLSSNGTEVALAGGTNPSLNITWNNLPVNLPENSVIESFAVVDGEFYILDSADRLYKSSDCVDWTDTGASMCHIYGAYGTSVIGVKRSGGKYYHVSYPAGAETEVAGDCPVAGTSVLMEYDSKWSDKPMVTFTGGRAADGTLSGSTWGYDGTSWAELSIDAMPPREGMAVCEYYEASVAANNKVATRKVLYAFGGSDKDGYSDRTLYVSVDRGVHWSEAASYLQFADYMPALAGAQAIVASSTLDVGGSRAVKPITSWSCPYIYVFGGRNNSGRISAGVYRGVLNQLALIPIL